MEEQSRLGPRQGVPPAPDQARGRTTRGNHDADRAGPLLQGPGPRA